MSMTEKGKSVWENAVCLSLVIRRPGITRKLTDDQYVTAADKDATKATKLILECDEYDRVGRIDTAFKMWLKSQQLQCEYIRGGMYPVAITTVEAIDAKLEVYKEERAIAIGQFMAVYLSEIEKRKEILRSLFNEADYLSEAAMRDGFQVEAVYVSFDTPSNLKSLKDGFFNRQKEKTEQRLNSAAEAIEHAMAKGLSDLVSHLHDKLTPAADGKKKVLRDAAIEKVLDFLEAFASRNITSDEELAKIVTQAKEVLEGVEGKELRTNAEAKKEIADKLGAITETLGDMVTARGRRIIL